MKEGRVIVRLIALWVVFVTSVVFVFWSVGNLVPAGVKLVTKGYTASYNYDSGYDDGSACLREPTYPVSSDYAGDTPESKAAMQKYNQDYENYKANYKALCDAGTAKRVAGYQEQEDSQKNADKSTAIGDLASSLVLAILSVIAAYLSCKEIKKSEQISS